MAYFFILNLFLCFLLADVGNGGFLPNQIKIQVTNIQDGKKYIAIKDGLFKDEEGYLYFRTKDWSQGDSPVYRFIFVVYSEKFETRGIKEMKAVIDADSFKSLGSSYYKDKNYIYYFKEMHDGGTMSIVDDVDYQSFELIEKTINSDAKDKLGLIYQGRRNNN